MEITVINHPLAAARLSIMRDARSDTTTFRAALADLGAMLIYEASRGLEVESFECVTPVATAEGQRLAQPPIIVPVIRAGLGMIDPALSMIPDAQVGFIGLARDEVTHEPVPYLEALPQDLSGQPVFLVDPMLATGGSLVHSIRLLRERGADDITCICMVSARPGVAKLEALGGPLRLVTAAIDPNSTTTRTSCRGWAMRAIGCTGRATSTCSTLVSLLGTAAGGCHDNRGEKWLMFCRSRTGRATGMCSP